MSVKVGEKETKGLGAGMYVCVCVCARVVGGKKQ